MNEATPHYDDGTQENQVPGSLEIENSVRLIVDEYLKTPLQSEQITSVKNALQIAATANRQIFLNNKPFLNRVIQKLITYCVNVIIEFENQQKLLHNCEIFEEILIDFISIYPARLRDLFTQRLIKAIQEYYLPETQNPTSVILPNIDDKSLRIKCNSGKASYFYLSLFLKMAQKFPLYDATLLELFQILLVTKNVDIQIMAIKLLAEFMTISAHTSFKVIRMILSFVIINFLSFVGNEEIDDLIVSIFSKAYNILPINVKPLIGREILSYLPGLQAIIDWKIMDTVLKCVCDFVSSDHVNAQLSASFFMKLFPDYFMKETFIDICKIIVRHSPNFKTAICKQFQSDFIHLSALLEISPDFKFDLNILYNVSPPNLYDIVSHLKELPEWLGCKVRNCLLTYPPPPSPRIIKSLIKFIPVEALTSYPPDILCLILAEDESLCSANYKILKRYALQKDNIKLVSFLAARHPEDQNEYSMSISNSAHDPNVWEDENFRKSIAIIRQNDKESTFQKEFFLKLYEKSRLRLMYLYAQEEPLWKQFLKPILQAINDSSDNHAAAAISVLHQLNNFQDIYARHSYYFFKHLLTLLQNPLHSHRFKSIVMCLFPQLKLIHFSPKIIPILIRNQDKRGITIYAQMCSDVQEPTDINIYINKLILESIPDIFVYLFVYVGIKERLFSESISFLQTMLNGVQPTSLLNNRVGIIGPQLLLYLGSDDLKHKKNAIDSINLINILCYKKKLEDTTDIMKFFWDQNFFVTIIDFSRILCDSKSRRNTEVFKSLINSVEYLEPFIHTCYPKILSITDIAMRKDSLRSLCIEFWLKLMNAITEKTIFSNIFGHIISQLLPYFDQFPDQITSVLRILIVDNESVTQHCFVEIAHIPLFQEKAQLQEINKVLQNAVKSDDWKSRIVKLAKQLDNTAPPFKRLILQQLRITLKAHQNELTIHDTSDLMRKLWLISTHEKTSENILYCAQCMALLPFDKETSPPEQKAVENDHGSLIRTIITDYLVKCLEDSSSLMNHDHAAYAIQQLLKVLGCSEKANTSDESLRQDRAWNLFPGDIQNIIFPFLKSRYRSDEKAESIEPLSKSIPSTVNHWLCNLAQYLLDLSTGSTVYFKHCSCVLPDSPSLCKFFLPYLCIENKENEIFIKALKKQWIKLLNLLNGNSAHQREFARQALRILFSLFDTLASFSINVGEKRGNLPERHTLGIASEIQLAEAAFQCELYQRALQHYEFHIHDGSGKFADCKEKLLQIYEHIDDPDGFEFLSRSKQNDFDDALVSLESQSLSVRSDPKKKLKLIHEMILKGRYERALSDAVSLKNLVPDSIEIDAVIANAAVRLQRWDEISLLGMPTDYKVVPPNHRQNVLDIITARLLYFKKTNNRINFEKDIQAFGDTIVPMFSSAANISYFRLIPILAQIRLIEEIEEFSSENSSFCHWEHEIPMKPIEIERIVSVRSALIGSFVEKEKGSMSMITNQWLQLARYCRKSSDLLNSKIFCSRAKIFVSSDSESPSVDLMYCSFEMAKIYWGLNHSNAALSLLKQIFTEDDKILCSKVKYIEANWSEKISSSDTKTIIDTYQESADLHQTGKAYLAIANVTDQRVIGFTNYLDQLAQDGGNSNAGGACAAQIRRNNSKFWTSSTQPANVFAFLKEQIPLALSNFMKAMICSPQYSFEVVPRILVLFFDIGVYMIPNSEKNLFHMITSNHKAVILSAMKEAILSNLQKVNSSIWVNSITQLISRIEQPSILLDILHKLIQPALQDYPQATFWHLMSVKRSMSRNACFFKLWEFFQSEFRSLTELKEINDLEIKFDKITPLLLDLISYVPERIKKTFDIQASDIIPELLKEFQDSKLLMPLSSSLMIQSTTTPQQYINSVPLIQSMDSKISVFPSLQTPKKITIQSTTGLIYHYLCKKDDDLRKDMRMMEFGSFVRSILSRDKRCRQRTLSIVTFAVVCLDERSGIIEWVEHTTGLRNIVESFLRKLGKGMLTPQLKQLLCDGVRAEPSVLVRKKQQNFIQYVLPAHPPVMHLFFANNFNDVSRWLQARLTYTRSTAVWSMVGYIVGLGDRHAENILYNIKTGACLHVDFSVLFDKGKTLTIPEIVPFRMTQNIVDGMGVLGTDGAFSAAATLVMEILREKKQKILSVLQTFIHDPLIEWKGRDGMDKTMAVVQAKLTLKEVERRLSGIAEDKSSTRSPECVVQELIKQATDNMNLALMFVGWQPYL